MEFSEKNYSEKRLTKAFKNKTAKLPSNLFLWTALGSIAASATLKCLGKKHTAISVANWAIPLLLLSFYNKIEKTVSHENFHTTEWSE